MRSLVRGAAANLSKTMRLDTLTGDKEKQTKTVRPIERGEWADMSQFRQMYVPQNLENAPAQVFTQLRHCNIASIHFFFFKHFGP